MKKLLSLLAITFYFPLSALHIDWKPTKYIWSLGYCLDADNCVQDRFSDPMFIPESYQNIQSGDIIWINNRNLYYFYEAILPRVENPFVLVITGGDEGFPGDFPSNIDARKLIEHPKIIHIFAQNNTIGTSHPKLSSIPIGLDFHTIALRPYLWKEEQKTPQDQVNELEALLATLKPTGERIPKAFVDFQHNDSIKRGIYQRHKQFHEDRTSIFREVLRSGGVDYCIKRQPRAKLWETKGKYAFSISPHGNGLDTHRTWEDLLLGCIVIVKTSPLDCLYEGLPVVIVKNWSEITKENLKKWQKQHEDAFTNPNYREKLTHQYWMNQIESKANPYKKKES